MFGARYLVTDRELDLPLLYDKGPDIYQDQRFDPRTEVILNHALASISVQGVGQGGDESPSVLREGHDRVIIDATMIEPGYLVATVTYYPGWRATVDGQPVEILEANHAFRAVQLDQGTHTILFIYDPLLFRLGGWITLAGLVVLVAIVTISGRYRRMYKK